MEQAVFLFFWRIGIFCLIWGDKCASFDYIVCRIKKRAKEQDKKIFDILPAHLGIEYDFWFLIWQELEDNFPSWRSIEELELPWTQLETFVEYL